MRRISAVVVLLAAVAAGTSPARASDSSVTIVGVNQGYSPGSVTVNPGDTVTWTNRDPTPAPHNAICDEGCPESFSSGPPGATGTTGSYRFRYSGTYAYKCAVHPNMKGAVVVTGDVHAPAAAAQGAAPPDASASASTGQSRSATVSANANSGAQASASASSGTGAPASSSATASSGDNGQTSASLPPVGQLALPEPQVRVRQAAANGTPWWVLVPASLVLLVAAVACGVAWLGPRPLRRPREEPAA